MKQRADQLLVQRGLAPSRARAQALIREGRVRAAGTLVERIAELLPADVELSIAAGQDFASRGGQKLNGALDQLEVGVDGAVCADLGASTGGFTDCLLRRGARRVYAVDVGRAQLDPRLRADRRVIVMDGVNARHLEAACFPEPLDLVVVDVSFISLQQLLPAIRRITPPGGHLLALVKPQFEVGAEAARRLRGVVPAGPLRDAAIASVRDAVEQSGLRILGECDSVLPGPRGNRERFLYAERPADHDRAAQSTSTQRS